MKRLKTIIESKGLKLNLSGATGGRVWVRLGHIKDSTKKKKKSFQVFQKSTTDSVFSVLIISSSSTWMFLLTYSWATFGLMEEAVETLYGLKMLKALLIHTGLLDNRYTVEA